MDNFRYIYRILDRLRLAMDEDEFGSAEISPDAVGVNDNRWASLIVMLAEAKYIEGVSVKYSADGARTISIGAVTLTLKGLEYLQTNPLMQTAAYIEKADE